MSHLPPLTSLVPAPTGVPPPRTNIDVTRTGRFNTGVYVVAVDPRGTLHFGFGRKVPPGRRQIFEKTGKKRVRVTNLGAAGTEPKYHGKWSSLGGGSDRNATNALEAAIIELQDEAYFAEFFPKPRGKPYPLWVDKVWIPWKGKKVQKGATPPSKPLWLLDARDIRGASIFLFQMEWNQFYKIFPNVDPPDKRIRGGDNLVMGSHGEMDFTASFTLEQMLSFQNAEVRQTQADGLFTGYTLRGFTQVVLPALEKSPIKASATEKQKLPGFKAALEQVIKKDTKGRSPDGWRDKVIYPAYRKK